MEWFLIGGGLFLLGYNSFHAGGRPKPSDGNPEGNVLPAPRFLYSDPKLWTSYPENVCYLPFKNFWGPNNDPRRAYLLFGGARIVHSGYNPVVKTNQMWMGSNGDGNTSGNPTYTPNPVKGTGVPQTVTSRTIFDY